MSNTLKNTNVKMAINETKRIVAEYWKQHLFEKNKPEIYTMLENNISGFLDYIKRNRGINQYSVEAYEHKYTWKMLYPNIIKRVLAMFAYKILKLKTYSDNIKWYHHVLPFEISEYPIVPPSVREILDKLDACDAAVPTIQEICELIEPAEFLVLVDCLKSADEYSKRDRRYATLSIPYSVMRANVKIQPTKAIEYIDVIMDTRITGSAFSDDNLVFDS